MVATVEETRTTTPLFSSPTLRLPSRENGTPNGMTLGKQFKEDVKQATSKVKRSKSKQLTDGLCRLHHFSCDSPVRFMMYSEAAAGFIGLHSDNTACLYKADGHKQTLSEYLPFLGLTATNTAGRLVGWGPGPVFTLLDGELGFLDAAHDGLDIRVCQAAERSTEMVTAGLGNVCVWSVMLMACKVKIQKELQHHTFTQMALAPPRSDRPHRAFVVCGRVVTVVDLGAGKVLEHKRGLCSRDITALVYCSKLDCLITASQELSIRVWGPDWELRVTFVGHNGAVNSLFYCSALRMLLSTSMDCTIRCWNVEDGDAVECVHIEQKKPPLCIGGNEKGDAFFSFSHQAVDVWTIRSLYTLHCKLSGDKGAPLRQIVASPFPAPYPTRLLCVSGDSDITLVAAETGAVLTSFKAKKRILCADYCLQKEILLALTDSGTVLQANTLTNPITLMQKWHGRGQEPWQQDDNVTENQPIPGPACCLILYSAVADTEGAFEEWRSLQESRGCSQRNKTALVDAMNKFLVILGHRGGYVSVLRIDNGKVLLRTPAHNGQRVTAMQAFPENGYFLSTGEDMTMVVWKVNPYVQECVSQQRSLHYGQPQGYLAALWLQPAPTFQEPDSDTCNLMHFNLLDQSQTDYSAGEGHSDHFTGLCACPDLEVFVSSSRDGTVCIWDKENHLIRMLQLNAAPQCLAYGGVGGELFLGIRGDLHRMNCAKFLPHIYQQILLYTYRPESIRDTPVIKNAGDYGKIRKATTDEDEEKEAIANNLLSTRIWRQKVPLSSVTSNMDLTALLRDSVKCHKGKPPSTKETRKEAFARYMNILYGLPLNIKIDFEARVDLDDFEMYPFDPEPYDVKSRILPTSKEDARRPEPEVKPWLQEKKTTSKICKPKPQMKYEIQPGIPKKPVKVKESEEPPRIISPKPRTPTPTPPRPKTPQSEPQWDPSLDVPTFLIQFADEDWFLDLFPNEMCIPSHLSPEDFALLMLGLFQTCSAAWRVKILAALQAMYIQGLLRNADRLYQGLLNLVPILARPPLSSMKRAELVKILNLLMCLKPASSEFVKTLLTLLAYKKLGLRDTVLRMLTTLGLNEAEKLLWPELATWDSELKDRSNIWKSHYDRADSWLELWISKYKEHNRNLDLKSTAEFQPLTFKIVDVLNYFCSVQKGEYRRAQSVAPAGCKNTVLLPLYDCSSRPIFRLGETYSMARSWRPPSANLPPMRDRPFLMHVPGFMSFPLPRVTLRPFRDCSDEDFMMLTPHRYYIPQQSYVEYYR